MERVLQGTLRSNFPSRIWSALAGAPERSILVIGVILALLLALPGETVVTRLIGDVFFNLDGVQRIASGQVPTRDFHTALGPLAFYLPALGYGLSGSLGAAMPLGMALVVLGMAVALAHILPSRLAPALAIPYGAFLLVIVAVPMNLGEGITSLSFNQYYNRIGWVGLAALVVLYLEPRAAGTRGFLLDGICALGLVFLLLYTRATYGIVALGFLVLMLTDRRQWRWAAASLVLVAIVAGLIEVFWGSSFAYVENILLAFAGGDIVRGSPIQWLDLFLGNLADYILLALLAGLLLWRRFSVRDLVFVLFCALAGFWLLNHNEQRWGILTIHAAAVVLAERLLRDMDRPGAKPIGTVVNPAGAQLFVFGILFPTLVHCTAALLLHFGTAVGNGGQSFGLDRLEGVRLVDLWTPGDFRDGRGYLDLVGSGLTALDEADHRPRKIVVLNGTDPFSIILNLAPTTSDIAKEGVLTTAQHFAPEQFFADVDTLLERLVGGDRGDLDRVYRSYIDEHFALVAENPSWKVFQRRQADTAIQQ